ncbi:class I SAM-dependent methyltransferase [Yoonia sp.]|uniref:class I SAM-dependent methyltransferase n=1 Tax=Yoonia sp. TaxID=2212373 RepID=UPI002FDA32E6
MITFEQLADASDTEMIRGLNVSAFQLDDVVNLILQRSEIIRDQPRPGRIVGAWSEGDTGPARALADRMGDVLVRRAAAVIWLEYQEIRQDLLRVAPQGLSDIGCGYAMFDLFAYRDFGCRLCLIDLEETDARHFGFRESGAAYANLATARQFLMANDVADSAITLCNPKLNDPLTTDDVDLSVSFISCGFHYPVETYMKYFSAKVRKGGAVIVDFRRRKARAGTEALSRLGEVRQLTEAAYGNALRMMATRTSDGVAPV